MAEQTSEYNTHQQPKKRALNLSRGEIVVLVVSFCLIAFVAIPNFLRALYEIRGRECSARLELIYNILCDIAEERRTRPGEEICQEFDINVRLDQMKAFIKVGAEPDCPDAGDFIVDFHLGEDGKPIPPKCTLGDRPDSIRQGLHRFVPDADIESAKVAARDKTHRF